VFTRSPLVERLIDAAWAVFVARGYHAATIHDICAAAQVGIGSFYAHFDDKGELLRQVMIERASTLPQLLTAEDFADDAALARKLRTAVEGETAPGLWRAWHEGIAQDEGLARFHLKWRSKQQAELVERIDTARRDAARAYMLDSKAAAWAALMFARELTIHEGDDAPDIETVARLIKGLVLGTV
jgi:AcrR family transcriptional regulator